MDKREKFKLTLKEIVDIYGNETRIIYGREYLGKYLDYGGSK